MSSVKDGVLDVEKFSSFDELINMLEKEVKERRKKFIVQIDELKQEDAQRVLIFCSLLSQTSKHWLILIKVVLDFFQRKIRTYHFWSQWHTL